LAATLIALPGIASANDGFASTAYPVEIQGTPESEESLSLGYGSFACSGNLLSGELSAASEELPLYAEGSVCSQFGEAASMEMKGCRYELRPETNAAVIGPAGCGPIRIPLPSCTIKIGPQTLPATYANTGKGTVSVSISTTSLQFTREKGYACSAGTFSNGHYDASWNLSAGSQELRVEDIAVGVLVTGKESAEPSAQPQVAAESYTSRLLGDQSEAYGLRFQGTGGVLAECQSAQFSKELTAAAKDLAVKTSLGGCRTLGLATTVKMNSCGYEFHVLNAGPPYAASIDVDCSVAGDGIEFDNPFCNVKIPAQSGLTGISLTNTGEGVNRGFSMVLNAKNAQYTVQKKNFLCQASGGSYSNGSFVGTVNWRGTKH